MARRKLSRLQLARLSGFADSFYLTAKRKRSASQFTRRKLSRREFARLEPCQRMRLKDCISSLPDDLVCKILKLLTLKEAVATSILSRRWRFSWTSLFSLDNLHYRDVCKLMDSCAYIRMVNQVIRLYEGSNLREFSFHCLLSEDSYCYIGRWVAFAIANGVTRLDLRLGVRDKRYPMPLDLFNETTGVEPFLKQLGCNLTSCVPCHSLFKTIKELWLEGIDLRDEVFEGILSHCSSLEHLYLTNIGELINAKNATPLPKLRCLEMYWMDDLDNLELFAPSLISFKYIGPRIHICFTDSPQLVDVSINSSTGPFDYQYQGTKSYRGPYNKANDFVFGQFADHLSQLEYLTLNAGSFLDAGSYWGKRAFLEVPVFSSLKQLSIFAIQSCHMPGCYHAVASFLKTSPLLQRLELHLPPVYPEPRLGSRIRELKLTPVSPHRNLREVLISGFHGDSSNVVFAVFILEHAPALEKIVITTSMATWSYRGYKGFFKENFPLAKFCLPRLHQRLPPRAQLLFLDVDD